LKLKLAGKLISAFLAIGLIPLWVLALIGNSSARMIADGASNQLHQALIATLDTIERSMFGLYGHVQTFATNGMFTIYEIGTKDFKERARLAGINRYQTKLDRERLCLALTNVLEIR